MLDPFVDFFLKSYRDHRHLHSFPTRRSSDLIWAPIPMRPVFNVSIATLYPTPTSPTTFAAGTSQPSRISSHVVEARMPSLSSFLPTLNPRKPRSTAKAVIPL